MIGVIILVLCTLPFTKYLCTCNYYIGGTCTCNDHVVIIGYAIICT